MEVDGIISRFCWYAWFYHNKNYKLQTSGSFFSYYCCITNVNELTFPIPLLEFVTITKGVEACFMYHLDNALFLFFHVFILLLLNIAGHQFFSP